jgi:hypothetical protein
MGPPLHARNQTVEAVGGSRWFITKAKAIPSAGKGVASVFWYAKGILLIDYLEKRQNNYRRILLWSS